ncbi:hypothetical protein ABW19_dt0208544 [Dactylella cylindrospora]|nr:hypothetical protein ABW19_dt0208544 [Dactylella cylindrospora]
MSIGIITYLIHRKLSEKAGLTAGEDRKEWSVQDAIYHLDFALIKTGGSPIVKEIHGLLQLVDAKLLPLVDEIHGINEVQELCGRSVHIPTLKSPGVEVELPSVIEWLAIYKRQQPIKLTKIIDHWAVFDTFAKGVSAGDASARKRSRWSSVPYLLSKTVNGRRIVPVEVGRTYTDPDLKQKIMTFREYIQKYLLREGEGSTEHDGVFGYLAQHNLLTQIPSLRDDISVPEYIQYTRPSLYPSSDNMYDSDDEDEEVKTTINAWLGPASTITPLHTDNYHNMFCQVVGTKYVRLYPPSATCAMYPMGVDERGINMSNTSSVPTGWVEGSDELSMQLEGDDIERWKTFRKEKYVEFVVREGEVVFFPKGWWHYVRSLETSFSVNFWWEGEV